MAAETERSATYREVFAVPEYRAVFGASLLSQIGDMLTKVAITILVFGQTGSPLLAAAAFAIGYLPWIAGGPLLATIADRLPWRRTMVLCDIGRMLLVALLAVPGIPLPALLAILFASALLAPPFESARAAMLPDILTGDRYVLGLAVNNFAAQASQVLGFAFGGALVHAIQPRGALIIDAATFLGSALLLRFWVIARPAPTAADKRSSLTRETLAGLRLVFGSRKLRLYTLLAWTSAAFAFAPEGLAAPFAKELGGGATTVGLLLAANPVGVMIGGIVIGRLTLPSRRVRAVRPLALLSVAALVPLAVNMPLWAIMLMYAASGFGMAFLLPLNSMFIRVLPISFRGRAFGVVQSGLMLAQGMAVITAGWAAQHIDVSYVIGMSGLIGVTLVALIAVAWPSERDVATAVPEPA